MVLHHASAMCPSTPRSGARRASNEDRQAWNPSNLRHLVSSLFGGAPRSPHGLTHPAHFGALATVTSAGGRFFRKSLPEAEAPSQYSIHRRPSTPAGAPSCITIMVITAATGLRSVV